MICTFAAKSIGEVEESRHLNRRHHDEQKCEHTVVPGLVPSAAFYAAMVVPVAILIYVGVLHDVGMYAIAVSAINIFLFTWSSVPAAAGTFGLACPGDDRR